MKQVSRAEAGQTGLLPLKETPERSLTSSLVILQSTLCEPCSKDKHSTWPFILDFSVSMGSINKFRLFYKHMAVKTHRLRQCPQTNQRIHCIKTHKRLNRNKAVSNHYPTTHLRSLNHAQQPPGGLLILWREIIQHLDSSHSGLLLTSQNHTGSWQSEMPGVPN